MHHYSMLVWGNYNCVSCALSYTVWLFVVSEVAGMKFLHFSKPKVVHKMSNLNLVKIPQFWGNFKILYCMHSYWNLFSRYSSINFFWVPLQITSRNTSGMHPAIWWTLRKTVDNKMNIKQQIFVLLWAIATHRTSSVSTQNPARQAL